MRVAVLVIALAIAPRQSAVPPPILPAPAVERLVHGLDATRRHVTHVWRDTPALNADGTLTGYVEIPRDDPRKWEYDIGRNIRIVDRVMPRDIGGYPVNYGFVPQTISYDGDPFDVLVLGPPLTGGSLVHGVIVGLMHMEDEKGLDSKVVISRVGADSHASHPLTRDEQQRIAKFFNHYKRHEPGKFAKVPGWGTAAEGLSFVQVTNAFFRACRNLTSGACHLDKVRR